MTKQMIFPELEGEHPLPLQVAKQWEFPLAYHVDKDGKYWYAVQDWLRGLIQKDDVRKLWSDIQIQMSDSIRRLPYEASDGKIYERDYIEDKGLYLIAQNLRSTKERPLLKKIKEFLAKSGAFVDLARRDPEAVITSGMIDPDDALNAVIEEYRRRGKTDEWIDARLTGIMKRNQFTAALREAIKDMSQRHYGMATNEIYLGLWNRTAENLREELSLTKKDNLRDHQPALGLMYQGIAEQVSAQRLKDREELTIAEGLQIIHHVATFIGKQAEETSQFLQMDLATGKPLLPA
jgi:hypothetical protein